MVALHGLGLFRSNEAATGEAVEDAIFIRRLASRNPFAGSEGQALLEGLLDDGDEGGVLVDGFGAHARVVEEAVVVEGLAVLLEVSEEGDVLGNGGVAPVVELGLEGLRGEDAVAVDDVVGGDLVGVGVGDVAGAPADNPRISARRTPSGSTATPS